MGAGFKFSNRGLRASKNYPPFCMIMADGEIKHEYKKRFIPAEATSDPKDKEKEIDKKDWKEARVQEEKAREIYDPRIHGFDKAIDKYYKDKKINKLLCETKQE